MRLSSFDFWDNEEYFKIQFWIFRVSAPLFVQSKCIMFSFGVFSSERKMKIGRHHWNGLTALSSVRCLNGPGHNRKKDYSSVLSQHTHTHTHLTWNLFGTIMRQEGFQIIFQNCSKYQLTQLFLDICWGFHVWFNNILRCQWPTKQIHSISFSRQLALAAYSQKSIESFTVSLINGPVTAMKH